MDENKNELIDPLSDIPRIKSPFIRDDNEFISTPSGKRINKSELINPMTFEDRDKSFEEKTYIILYVINGEEDDDVYSRSFSVCIGRTMAYEDIKEKLISGLDIDVHRSKVITETKQTETKTGNIKYSLMPYNECISVYAFITSISSFYDDDEFDIEDYSYGDVPEDNGIKERRVMSSEQIEYRRMLEESISRREFINTLRENNTTGGTNV